MPAPARLPKLAPTIDVVFRLLFDDKDGCRLLISLLNGLLHLEGEDRIRDLEMIPRGISGSGAEDKEVVLDVRARTRSGRQFNIEVQVRPFVAYPERILYYLSGMYRAQLRSGGSYEQLQPAISVNLLCHNLLPDEEPFCHWHSDYELMCRRTGHCLTGHLQVHILELRKFRRQINELADEEQKWLFFLQHGHELTANEVKQMDLPEIDEAEQKLDLLSQDWVVRTQAELREKAELDARSFYHDWREKARRDAEEGRKQGHKEGEVLGLRQAVFDICEILGIQPSAEQTAALERMDADQLTALRSQLKTTRSWPRS